MDRTIRGLVAGITAGVLMNVINLIDFYFLHITKLRFFDWSWVLTTLQRPITPLEIANSIVIQLVWDGVLGICFAHLVSAITSQAIVIKSVIYSVFLWFLFKVAVNFYRIPVLAGASIQTTEGSTSNLVSIILWGIVMGLMLKYLDQDTQNS